MLENGCVQTSPSSWQEILKNAVSSPAELLAALNLPAPEPEQAARNYADFSLKVPRTFIQRMRPGDPQDPLLLQVLPSAQELITTPGFKLDGLDEAEFRPLPGVLHKYANRILLTLTGACAVHCRYCFRRHYPYSENNPAKLGWEKIVNYIQQHPQIEEIIFSGGDPLIVPDEHLFKIIENFMPLAQIKFLRFHTRLPVMIPQRITPNLLAYFKKSKHKLVMILHINHPQEINSEIQAACAQLTAAGVKLFNQTVLLKNINADPAILAELSHKLFACDILPYYLHLPDKVQNTGHFYISKIDAIKIYQQLQAKLSGYLLPKLVEEIPGQASKTIIS